MQKSRGKGVGWEGRGGGTGDLMFLIYMEQAVQATVGCIIQSLWKSLAHMLQDIRIRSSLTGSKGRPWGHGVN